MCVYTCHHVPSPDIPPYVEDQHREEAVGAEGGVGGGAGGLSREEEEELSRIQGEDAISLLDALDSEVSHLVSWR